MAPRTPQKKLVDGQHVTTGEWEAHGSIRVFISGDAFVALYGSKVRVWASGRAMIGSDGAATIVAADQVSMSVSGTERVVAIGYEDGNPLVHALAHARVDAYGWSAVEVGTHAGIRVYGRSVAYQSALKTVGAQRARVERHGRAATACSVPAKRMVP